MSKVISPIMTDGTGMAIAQAINHATAVQLALNTASYEEDGTLLEVQDARTVNETQYASLGEAIRTEVTRIDNEKEVQAEALEGHADRITAVENKANTNATNISKLSDDLKNLDFVNLNSLITLGKTSNMAGIVWKTGRTIIIQKCLKATSEIVKNDVLMSLPYSCHWTYINVNYGEKSLIASIDSDGKDIVLSTNTTIPSGGVIVICGAVVTTGAN